MTTKTDLRAHNAGEQAYRHTFARYALAPEDGEPVDNEHAEGLAQDDRDAAIAKVYARAAYAAYLAVRVEASRMGLIGIGVELFAADARATSDAAIAAWVATERD